LLLADHEERAWPDHLLPPLETLTTQFAWFRHYRYYLSHYAQDGENLQTLNWYKHRCLETLHQSVGESISALLELEAKMPSSSSANQFNQGNLLDSGENDRQPTRTGVSNYASTEQPLRQMRRQHILQQLEQTLALLTPVLNEEEWQLSVSRRAVALASLLKRSLRRVEPLYKQRQLILKIHNPIGKNVYGDRLKLECVIFELLITSCFHAQPGSLINLWCCPPPSESKTTPSTSSSPPLVELLIAENGLLDDYLNALSVSVPEPPPTLNLKICQQVLRSWGGELQFYPLEDVSRATSLAEQNQAGFKEPRYFSRLLLPLAH
jgi:hypothetical protein